MPHSSGRFCAVGRLRVEGSLGRVNGEKQRVNTLTGGHQSSLIRLGYFSVTALELCRSRGLDFHNFDTDRAKMPVTTNGAGGAFHGGGYGEFRPQRLLADDTILSSAGEQKNEEETWLNCRRMWGTVCCLERYFFLCCGFYKFVLRPIEIRHIGKFFFWSADIVRKTPLQLDCINARKSPLDKHSHLRTHH